MSGFACETAIFQEIDASNEIGILIPVSFAGCRKHFFDNLPFHPILGIKGYQVWDVFFVLIKIRWGIVSGRIPKQKEMVLHEKFGRRRRRSAVILSGAESKDLFVG